MGKTYILVYECFYSQSVLICTVNVGETTGTWRFKLDLHVNQDTAWFRKRAIEQYTNHQNCFIVL